MRCEETDNDNGDEPHRSQAKIGGGQRLKYICVFISRLEWGRKAVMAEFVMHTGDFSGGEVNAEKSSAGMSVPAEFQHQW